MALKKISDYRKKEYCSAEIHLARHTYSGYCLTFNLEIEKGKIKTSYNAGCRHFNRKESALRHWERRQKEMEDLLSKEGAKLKKDMSSVRRDINKLFFSVKPKFDKTISLSTLKEICDCGFIDTFGEIREIKYGLRKKGYPVLPDWATLTLRILVREYHRFKYRYDDISQTLSRAKLFHAAIMEFPEEAFVRKYKK